jgi:hypothetical protein
MDASVRLGTDSRTIRALLRRLAAAACAAVAFLLVSTAHAQAPPGAAEGLAAPNRDAYPVTQLPPVSYTAFDGHTETLVPWQGQNVSLLEEPGASRDPRAMANLVRALDRAWNYYADTTGRLPATASSLNGRTTIAEVTSTCGAGCGYLGATGIEILAPYFESMYQQVSQQGLYDQIPFYELGRNFWFWSPQLAFQAPDQDPVVTGFAVWMRFESMAAAGVEGGPFNGRPFATFVSEVAALAGEYEANPALTFADTLAQSRSPGAYGGTDFWASLMMQLSRRHGDQTFISRFWHNVGDLPAGSSTADAVANWEQAASDAACTDLSSVFYVRWGFPRPDGSLTVRPPANTVPEPTGSCAPPPPENCVPGSGEAPGHARRHHRRPHCPPGQIKKRNRDA